MLLITAGRTHTEHLVLAAQSSATADLRSDLAPHGSLRLFVPDAMTTMSGVWFSTCERTFSPAHPMVVPGQCLPATRSPLPRTAPSRLAADMAVTDTPLQKTL